MGADVASHVALTSARVITRCITRFQRAGRAAGSLSHLVYTLRVERTDREKELGMGDKAPGPGIERPPPRRVAIDGEQRGRGPTGYDWTYHGTWPKGAVDDQASIAVEQSAFGPTERADIVVLRELPAPLGGFGWGYNGGGPARAATAILDDALELGGLGSSGIFQDRTLDRLRYDFCWDVLTQMCDEWRLRRGAVLRWVRGWYTEHGIMNLPRAVAELPPADPYQNRS